MINITQSIIGPVFSGFAFVGLGFTAVLVLSNLSNKEEFKIDVKPVLAGILFIIGGILVYSLLVALGLQDR